MAVARAGHDVVLMRREAAPGGGLRRACNAAFYRGLAVISALPLEPDASDFFLVGRPVIDVLQREIRERTRFLRGLVQWVGFRRAVLSYTAAPRRSGRSKYHLGRLFSLARDATLAFSTAPLRVAFVAAIAMLLACLATAVYSLGGWWLGNPPSGYTTIMLFSTAVAAAQFGLLGILGEYIGQLVDEAKGRPVYIVARRTGEAADNAIRRAA
jgi:dolichol-phosphate mannosyltransferase